MESHYIYIEDLRQAGEAPENGILSRTLQNDERSKVILFAFAPGQELSAHTAPFPATLCFLEGTATLRLDDDTRQAREGTFVHMAPLVEHGIHADSVVRMLLVLHKNPPAE